MMKKVFFALGLFFAFTSLQGQGAMFLRGSQPAPQPGAGILDSYPGAAAAFSLDALIYSSHSVTDNTPGSETQGQTGPYTIQARRSSDNALRSFTPTEVSDGTLTTWTGPLNDATVAIWYNQGSAGDATQTTTTNQPKIVDNGALVLENGKAAFNIIQNAAPSLSISSLSLGADCTAAHITKISSGDVAVLGTMRANTFYLVAENGSISAITQQNVSTPSYYLDASLTVFTDRDSVHDAFSLKQRLIFIENINLSSETTFNFSYGNVGFSGFRTHQSFIIYTSDQSTNRTNIETALNNYYNIY